LSIKTTLIKDVSRNPSHERKKGTRILKQKHIQLHRTIQLTGQVLPFRLEIKIKERRFSRKKSMSALEKRLEGKCFIQKYFLFEFILFH